MQGLCSRYIKSLGKGSTLALTLSRNNPPPSGDLDFQRPLVAIATGTGIAPIRSVIQERASWESDIGPTLLFFGCRSQNADYYFQDEWKSLKEVQVIPAFSRDAISTADQVFLDPYADQKKNLQATNVVLENEVDLIGPQNTGWTRSFDYDRGKMYVQHQIRRHAHHVCALLKKGFESDGKPIIMICGNAGRMPLSVRHALEDALVIGGLAKDNEEAKRTLQSIVWMETW